MQRSGARVALSTDLYELTMGASLLALGMNGSATFSLFLRNVPKARSFLVVAGIEEAVSRLTSLRSTPRTWRTWCRREA